MRSIFTIPVAVLAISGTAHAQSTPPAASTPKFISIDADALLTSRLIGTGVQTTDGESLGKIEDMALAGGQLVGVIVSVGEALGSSRRYIAVDPSSISIRYTESENKWTATLNAKGRSAQSRPGVPLRGQVETLTAQGLPRNSDH